jgi:glycosyltransferase involved in cell wall biosynthesis/2-polyprenyl-3-methyl-5-hydroxy-6-metoxy-1,4-benzoquinol methylase
MTRGSPVAFYDRFARKLLADYASGNPRTEQAILFAISMLPGGWIEVLDIGCGIGWSTSEIASNRPDARVRGVDLSPRLVTTARSLFGREPRLRFEACDFIEDEIEGEVDAIVLLDVYEHFPASARALVHDRFRTLLKDDGCLILTVPTPEHQQFMRNEHPGGVQPIDEDVSGDDVERLAHDIEGRVVARRTVSVWHADDYMHALIQRGPRRPPSGGRMRLEDPRARALRIRRALGLRWTQRSEFVAARQGPRVCVATWSLTGTSETFIHAHAERIPASVHVLQGSPVHRMEGGRSLLPASARAAARVVGRASGLDSRQAEDLVFRKLPASIRARLYARYLRGHGIRVVLAEYGPVAAEVDEGCMRAGVPLVVHFHGYDAFKHDVLEVYGEAYRSIFRRRRPIVVVSESMRRQLMVLGATEDQLFLNPYGVDLELFRPDNTERGLVVAVGRFIDKKAPELTVLAFSKVLERVPEARLAMIGDGPLRPAVERVISALRLEDRVRLLGAQDHAHVAELMRRAAVFIQHSVVAPSGDREGTPVAILEAGAAGIPVVATRHEGIVDVVIQGETGLLVEEGDVNGMAAAVADLLSDQERARQLGEAARRRIEAKYSMRASIDGLWAILERAFEC